MLVTWFYQNNIQWLLAVYTCRWFWYIFQDLEMEIMADIELGEWPEAHSIQDIYNSV